MKKRYVYFVFLLFALVLSFFVLQSVSVLNELEGNFITSYEDVENANKNRIFGSFISSELKEDSTGVSGQKSESGQVIFKLFGFLPIKKVNVRMNSDKEYYVGGQMIGFDINSSGVIVVENDGHNKVIKKGDIITKIDEKPVLTVDDAIEVVDCGKNDAKVEFLRNNNKKSAMLKKYSDSESRMKLGLVGKDEISGAGTITYVDKEFLNYGALGHPVLDEFGQNIVPVLDGKAYRCNLIGIEKGKVNKPGHLRCVFVPNIDGNGSIEKNSKFGLCGVLSDKDGFVEENKTAKLGGRLGVKMGKAKIVSCVSGIMEEYDIEIIKAKHQKSAKEKSIVFKVKDKRLLSLTGGIVQGMSGSPIIQDGKIVGAVTHVFTSDPTKGYGVYVDWMV